MTYQKQNIGDIPLPIVSVEMKTQKINYEINCENGP